MGGTSGGGEIFSIDFQLSGKAEEISQVMLKEAQINGSQIKEKIGSVVIFPSKSMLYQNYPNPFNPETWIPFKLAENADVVIHIYDVSGRLVRELELGFKEAGSYMSRTKAVYWNGRNEMNERLASGVYVYRMTAGGKTFVRKMVILK
jgi:flagellar hook assembly protein FlgD